MEIRNTKSFWTVGYALLMLMVGTNLPSPLYGVYKHLWNFSSGTLTLVFAVYALAIIPSLLLFGRLSDRIGRKRVLIPGMMVAALGSVLFASAQNVTWLFVARAIQGVSVGIVSGAATAALTELHPARNVRKAALIASAATAAGTALGPIAAGLLAQYFPWPTKIPYLLHVLFMLPGIIGVSLIPETVTKKSTAPTTSSRLGVPRSIRGPFFIASSVAFIAWAVTALFMSLVPSYVASLMHVGNLALIGGVVFLMLVASTIVQLLFRKLSFHTAMGFGLGLLVAGLAGVVCAVPLEALWLMLVSTLVTGLGQGLAFMGSMALVNHVVPADRRGDVASSFYVVIYCGVGIPVIGIGYAAQAYGLFHAVESFAWLVGIISIVMLLVLAARKTGSDVQAPAQ